MTEDLLGRKADEHCIKYWIQNNSRGVMAIDGAWGSGKSWLGSSLYQHYQSDETIVPIWIDTFQADWDDDPEMAIFSALFSSPKLQAIKNRATSIATIKEGLVKCTGLAGKLILQAASKKFLGDAEALENFSQEALGNYIDKKLESIKTEKEALEQIRKALSEIAKDNKIIIFVDELDRCSPSYAVKFLERIKHLFNADGVIIVLLWNADQLASSLSKFYGNINAEYFQKFVNWNHTLFNVSTGLVSSGGSPVSMNKFITPLLSAFKLKANEAPYYANYTDVLFLTARECERYIEMIQYAPPSEADNPLFLLLAALKAKKLKLVKDASTGDSEALKQISQTLINLNFHKIENAELFAYFQDIRKILSAPPNSNPTVQDMKSTSLKNMFEGKPISEFIVFYENTLRALFISYAPRPQ
ncbi:AAA family ATPase [Polynucleobacter sp. JS-Safj-400b-B2]|uniref:KAP family P-loop NTPase fold protein n=1 Tax=Polynucleobacter sp. JS-Safj-400b-B2 TaxID=2576921 RepID=UPI001C0CF8D9|nr:P-loop NTPase fold protein [Polynucleobacter sp. JS-Safj-400b-B2]MBU3624761.1 AAA family ATPase [Polynucleobacter sp. JS-Safj-400b-B2]